jgi:uncharacterized protein YqjF (DUF2071 family)
MQNPYGFPFMMAEWRHILFLNYSVDPAALAPWIPAGTTLDLWEGKAVLSMVCYLSTKTRVAGAAVPFHTRFDGVNLRFYVQRTLNGETRKGVAFIRQFVPRWWIAEIAHLVYREKFTALPIQHTVETRGKELALGGLVEYTWVNRRKRSRMGGLVVGEAFPVIPGSEEAFLSVRNWGYTRVNARWTGEYRVEHPVWRIRPLTQAYFLSDVQALYGKTLAPFLHHSPRSAFVADGSPVTLFSSRYFRK